MISWVVEVSFVLMGSIWVGSWMALGHQKDQVMIGGLEFSAPAPHSLEKGEGLKMELMLDHDYGRKAPQNPQSVGFRELPGW